MNLPLFREYRKTAEYTLGIGFLAFGVYLRLFIFLHLSWGAMIVFVCLGGGLLLIEDARRIGRRQKELG